MHHIKLCAIALLFTCMMTATPAFAEHSVAYTYNDLFGTDLSQSDVMKLRSSDFNKWWTLSEMNTLQIMVMDTANTQDIYLKVKGGNSFLLYDNSNWNGNTRGYGDELISSLGEIDLAAMFNITNDDKFILYIGDPSKKHSTYIGNSNSRLFYAPDSTTEFLLGFNDNGNWKAGDGDLNEPLIYGKVSATPLPAAVWLLGTGIIGLIGFRRKKA